MKEGTVFAGHSLGEYAALASIGDVLTIDSLVDVTAGLPSGYEEKW